MTRSRRPAPCLARCAAALFVAVSWSAHANTPVVTVEDFDSGQYETIVEPGFEVDVQNCNGTESIVDLMPMPRPLSHRFAHRSVTVAMNTWRGRPRETAVLAGDRELYEELEFALSRSRYADVAPHCVLVRVRVTDTVQRAADVVSTRAWLDVVVEPDGSVSAAAMVDNLREDVAGAIERRALTWTLEGAEYERETSVLVVASLAPSRMGGYDLTTELLRVGPRPVREIAARYPQHLFSSGIDGYVRMEFRVDAKGRPIDPKVIDAQPQKIFNRAALSAVKRWRYRPDKVGGRAVESGPVRAEIVLRDPLPPTFN